MNPEIRASEIKVGHRVTEDGMEPVVVAKLGQHGDTMLVTGTEGEQHSFDIDTTVEVEFEYGIDVNLRAVVRVWAGTPADALAQLTAIDAIGLDARLVDNVRLTEVSLHEAHPDLEIFETEDELDGEPKEGT